MKKVNKIYIIHARHFSPAQISRIWCSNFSGFQFPSLKQKLYRADVIPCARSVLLSTSAPPPTLKSAWCSNPSTGAAEWEAARFGSSFYSFRGHWTHPEMTRMRECSCCRINLRRGRRGFRVLNCCIKARRWHKPAVLKAKLKNHQCHHHLHHQLSFTIKK